MYNSEVWFESIMLTANKGGGRRIGESIEGRRISKHWLIARTIRGAFARVMVNRHLLSNFIVTPPPVNHSSGPDEAAASLSVGVVVGIVIGAIGAASLSVVLVWWIQAKFKTAFPENEKFREQLSRLPPRFSFKDLEIATQNFCKQLGAGGFGTVYEGVLADGVKVAVKKLHYQERPGKDFLAEGAAVGGINHKHLVRLLGFCAEGSERLLVYEFVPKTSLDRWLFSNNKKSSSGENHQDDNNDDIQTKSDSFINWSQRFSIALGTAKGLAYLHDDCGHRILHLDIKPQNILLDDKFEPKVADFGLCELIHRGHITNLTNKTMRGTPGYTAPEWMFGVGITEKGDVYSYGMVLFELISGRPNIDSSLSESVTFFFPALANKVVRDVGYGPECLKHLADPRLEEIFDQEQMTSVLKVAMWCIQEVPKSRPQMREVVLMLDNKLSIPDPPLMKFSGLLQAQRSMIDQYEAQQTLSHEQIEKVYSFDSPPPTSSESSSPTSDVSVYSSTPSV